MTGLGQLRFHGTDVDSHDGGDLQLAQIEEVPKNHRLTLTRGQLSYGRGDIKSEGAPILKPVAVMGSLGGRDHRVGPPFGDATA